MELCTLLYFGWVFFFAYLVVIHVLHMPSNYAEKSTLTIYSNYLSCKHFWKKHKVILNLSSEWKIFFALGNSPDNLVDTNVGYSSQLFLPVQFS